MQKKLHYMLTNALGSEEHISTLIKLGKKLLYWNQKTNLTGYQNLKEVITGLFLDSLALKPLIVGNNILDIGSGAGFPGLILAIILPKIKVTTLESRNKRINFQKQAINLLDLKNVYCIHSRAKKNLFKKKSFKTITIKAVGNLQTSLKLASDYLAPTGRILLPRHEKETKEATTLNLTIIPYKLPSPEGKRIIAIFQT